MMRGEGPTLLHQVCMGLMASQVVLATGCDAVTAVRAVERARAPRGLQSVTPLNVVEVVQEAVASVKEQQ